MALHQSSGTSEQGAQISPRLQRARGMQPAESAPSVPNVSPSDVPSGSASGVPSVSLESVLEQVHDLPAMPQVALRVMQATNQPNASTRDLAEIISQDPSFSVRILRLANSAYYGLPRAVSTIREAVLMLGNHTLRNLALISATHEVLGGAVAGYELEPGQLWRHSMACALATERLAQMTHYPDSDEAFAAGLLHDVGKLILGIHIREAMPAIRAYMEANGCGFDTAERAILGFDHAEAGGRMARKWNLPTTLVQAIAWHHAPERQGAVPPLTALVHIGNLCCLMGGFGLGADGLSVTVSQGAIEALQIEEAHIEQILDYLTQPETLTLLTPLHH